MRIEPRIHSKWPVWKLSGVEFRELPLVMTPSKVGPQWHEIMARRVLHFSAFISHASFLRENKKKYL